MTTRVPFNHFSSQAIMEADMRCENLGYCIACGEEDYDCEPDARKRRCGACKQMTVYGGQEIMLAFPQLVDFGD